MRALAKHFAAPMSRSFSPLSRVPAKLSMQWCADGQLFRQEAAALAAITPPVEVAADHQVFIAFDLALWRNALAMSKWLNGPFGSSKTEEHEPPKLPSIWLKRTFKATTDLTAKSYNLGGFTGD